jgi:L-histidine N-alpha-methyltransferase
MRPATEGVVRIDRHLDIAHQRTLAEDVLDGLTRPFKELPPKHFYDARGSELFEQICELPEYYPTRTERAILERSAAEIVELTGACELVELGAGYATKTRVLLDAMREAGTLVRYIPVDVSETTVDACARDLLREYPGLEVHGIVGDFERHLVHLPPPCGPRLVVFLGGTIGNLLPGARRRFLRSLARVLGPDGHLLLGTDLVKDPRILEAAYDDSAGVTAEFNRNVLCVVNRELDADFDLTAFDHVAFFDREHEWIEMRLRARSRQTVRIGALDLTVRFAAREEMRTEISAKFTPERLDGDLRAGGLTRVGSYTDPSRLFAVTVSRPLSLAT